MGRHLVAGRRSIRCALLSDGAAECASNAGPQELCRECLPTSDSRLEDGWPDLTRAFRKHRVSDRTHPAADGRTVP